MRVFFYEAFKEEEAWIRRFLPPAIEAGFDAGTIHEAGHDDPPAPLISVRTQSWIPDRWQGQLTALLSRSTGYDHLTALGKRFATPPAMGYLPLYCHTAVAEHVLMVMLALSRRLTLQIAHFERFHRDGLTGRELHQRTVAVFGVGHIGHEVVRLCNGIGMQVLGVDRNPSHDDVPYVPLDQALQQADIVVCAMDLRADNHGYFGPEQLAAMKPGALFINISRGELCSSIALLQALESGHLGGAALDVYNHERALAEPLRAGQEPTDPEAIATLALARRQDVICTPHNGFNTLEAVQRKAEHSVMQVRSWLDRGRFLWPAP